MNWSSSRKTIYAIIFTVVLILSTVYLFRGLIFPKPTCYDKKQNGYEEGMDCGGNCSKRCVEQIIPLQVLWSRALPVGEGLYDIVGLISNRNQDSAPDTISVTFTIYNAKADVIFTRKIAAVSPTTGDLPVMIQNLKLKESPAKVVLTVQEGPYYKIKKSFQTIQIGVSKTSFENGEIKRAYSTITNLTRSKFINFPVRIILYDGEQNAIAAGETFVESLDKNEQKDLVFTWKNDFTAKPVVIKAYPILSPF